MIVFKAIQNYKLQIRNYKLQISLYDVTKHIILKNTFGFNSPYTDKVENITWNFEGEITWKFSDTS